MTATRALTLHQPWASLIALGIKAIETRSWEPTDDAIGRPLAIHAASRIPAYARMLFHDENLVGELRAHGHDWTWGDRDEERLLRTDLPLGAVVCTARLFAAVLTDDIVWVSSFDLDWQVTDDGDVVVGEHQRVYGDFTPGRWAWLLDDVHVLREPAPARGNQGFWTWRP